MLVARLHYVGSAPFHCRSFFRRVNKPYKDNSLGPENVPALLTPLSFEGEESGAALEDILVGGRSMKRNEHLRDVMLV